MSKADSHPALPPGRIQNRLHSQYVDSQKRIHSQSGNEKELHNIRPSKIQSTVHSGNNKENQSDTLKNWTERKEDKGSSNEKNVVEGRVDLQHPVFSQEILEELKERREETPPMETSLDDLNGMQCMMMIILKKKTG